MPNITTVEVNDSTPVIVAKTALAPLKERVQLAGMINRDYDEDVAEYGNSVQVPIRGALVANDKAANAAVTLQNPSDSNVTVTLNKHKEVSFLIEDPAKAFARPDIMQGYASDAVDRLVEQIDADISANFSSFSSIGGGGSTMNRTLITQARQNLNNAKAPVEDRHAVLGPGAEQDLLDSDTFTFANYTGSPEAFRMGTLGQAFGFTFDLNTQLPTDGGTPNGERNFFFHRDALTIATRPLASVSMPNLGVFQSTVVVDGIALRSTVSYNANYLGLQVTFDVLYGTAVLRSALGLQVIAGV